GTSRRAGSRRGSTSDGRARTTAGGGAGTRRGGAGAGGGDSFRVRAVGAAAGQAVEVPQFAGTGPVGSAGGGRSRRGLVGGRRGRPADGRSRCGDDHRDRGKAALRTVRARLARSC